MDLSKIDVQLEHNQDERNPDRIVLRPNSGETNIKTWITLSGYNISSLKSSTELNRFVSRAKRDFSRKLNNVLLFWNTRLEWVAAFCGNTARLNKQKRFCIDPNLIRFKRGWMKQDGAKLWCELDEYTFKVYTNPKVFFQPFVV